MRLTCALRLLFLAVFICGAAPLRAELIVGTEPEGDGGFGVGFSFDPEDNLVIGQKFFLFESVVADQITVYLNGDGTDEPQGQFTLYLTNAVGSGATAANVLLTQTGTFPAGFLPTGHAPVTFSGLGLALDAGSYYLVISSAAGPGTGWGSGAPALSTAWASVGNAFVGYRFGQQGDYTDLDPENPNESHVNFRIDAVPEPSSVLLLLSGAGLMGLAQIRRRRLGERS